MQYQESDLLVLGEGSVIDLRDTLEPGYADQVKHAVASGIDLVTARFKQTAYVGSPYLISMTTYNANYELVATYPSDLQIKVTSESINRIET